MRFAFAVAALAVASVEAGSMDRLMELKHRDWERAKANGMFGGSKLYPKRTQVTPCVDGYAGEYRCNNVDMHGFLSHEDLRSPNLTGNDVWGWVSPRGREFGLVGQTDGTAFVEIDTRTGRLDYIGRLPTQTPDEIVSWRDIKVIGDYAYIGSEAENHGLQIFNLRQLEKVRRSPWQKRFRPKEFSTETDISYFDGFGASHNLVADSDRQIIYGVGGRSGANGRETPCAGGLFAVDVSDPENPFSPTCIGIDGYVHDAQCVIYDGPSTQYNGKNICFGFNEDSLTIYDVTDLMAPQIISKTNYTGSAYSHQGWLTSEKDMRWLLLDDELDEIEQVGPPAVNNRTTTYLFNIENLEKPVNTGTYQYVVTPPSQCKTCPLTLKTRSPDKSIDHNQYVVEGLSYQANYGSGLRVVDVSGLSEDPSGGNLEETAFFDCHPEDDNVGGVIEFLGTWSVYPYFPSGYILLNSIERGIFSLKYNGREADF